MPSEDLYREIVENMHDGIYFVDRERRITYWNKGAERITGYTAVEVVGSSCSNNILIHVDAMGRQLCKGSCPLIATMADGAPHETEVYLHHKQGHRLPVWVRTSPLPAADGSFIGAVEMFTEISSRQALQAQVEELKKLALVDRADRPSEPEAPRGSIALAAGGTAAQRDRLRPALHGHRPLQAVQRPLRSRHRRPGPDHRGQHPVAFGPAVRHGVPLGRGEFAGIFPHTDAATLEAIAERLRILVAHSRARTASGELTVTVSIGGTVAEADDSAASLVKRADTLMYASKTDGRNRVTIREAG